MHDGNFVELEDAIHRHRGEAALSSDNAGLHPAASDYLAHRGAKSRVLIISGSLAFLARIWTILPTLRPSPRTETLHWNLACLSYNGPMVWGERTNRISGVSVSRKQKRLASTAAEVFTPVLTAPAWQLHPSFTAELLKGHGFLPDPGQRLFTHIVEGKTRNHFGCMARQGFARGIDHDHRLAPPAHTRLGKPRIVRAGSQTRVPTPPLQPSTISRSSITPTRRNNRICLIT